MQHSPCHPVSGWLLTLYSYQLPQLPSDRSMWLSRSLLQGGTFQADSVPNSTSKAGCHNHLILHSECLCPALAAFSMLWFMILFSSMPYFIWNFPHCHGADNAYYTQHSLADTLELGPKNFGVSLHWMIWCKPFLLYSSCDELHKVPSSDTQTSVMKISTEISQLELGEHRILPVPRQF